MIGRQLSHYRIVEEVSRGGMGVVYRATDTRLNRDVALKILPDELMNDADRRRRFVQEAQAASAIEHPHIAVIHEVDEAEGISFISMELVRGEKLRDLMERRRMSPSRALELATEIAQGLARAHDTGVAHRDLKPGNVMVTEDGHAKIIDFGLAKLIERPGGLIGAENATHEMTDPGVVLGTVNYMSPEQAAGDRVDHRTDVFSFGVLLFEMLTGQLPFKGRTSIDVLHAILNQPLPRLSALAGEPPEATSAVQRLLDKCLAKDAADRYQGMRDIVVDLRATRRLFESAAPISGASAIAPATKVASEVEAPSVAPSSPSPASVAPSPSNAVTPAVGEPPRRVSWRPIAVAASVAAALGIGVTLYLRQDTTPVATSGRPSVAVMYFENNTGNDSLDWLRTGLTDMMVTDLSQSPDIEVLSTDRLYQILSEMKRADDRVISGDVVQAVARRAGIKTVLLGSYVKAGDVIRINVKMQDAETGRLVSSDRIDSPDESKLFSVIDELTRRIKSTFKVGAVPSLTNVLSPPGESAPVARGVWDRGLTEVTTSSIEAYRYYIEAMTLHQRFKEAEAITLLEKAIAIDPKFAIGLARLATIHGNLGRPVEANQYAQRALEQSANLSPRERLYIEAVNYNRRPETVEKAFDTYKQLVDLYPDHDAGRHNLATVANTLERDEVAIQHAEELRRVGMTFPPTYSLLANAYARGGDFEKGVSVWREYMQRFPDNAQAQISLGTLFVSWGKLDDAVAAYAKARALAAPEQNVLVGEWSVAIQRDDYPTADALAQMMTALSDNNVKFGGWMLRSAVAGYRGRERELLDFAREANRFASGPNAGTLVNVEALLALDRNEVPRALSVLQKATTETKSPLGPPIPALTLLAVAQARAGRTDQANATLKTIQQTLDARPAPNARRNALLAAGQVALARGDTTGAISALTQAQTLLRPRFLGVGAAPSQAVNIWYALGQAHLAAGDRRRAGEAFSKIAEGGTVRAGNSTQFVRSFYFLGQIAEKDGDQAKAREYYKRFVGYWGDGDMDRERVTEVRKKIG